ncbi:hypothetical protein [Ammoniphilus sp. 3BR4]|uniref:hypothetical protein n=1 Tax=Ammoniphilus sp. 3BR4 TaxID=3158265 RepID=UPI003467806E
MQLTKATGKELVERWIYQNRGLGRTTDQMEGTTFVYGNEILTLTSNKRGTLDIQSKQTPVVIFRKMDELEMRNICRACSLEHTSYKEAVECCVDIEE